MLRSDPDARRLSIVERESDPRPIRVVISDGLELVRAGHGALLDADERVSVIGEAPTGKETLAQVERLRPDVVLVDAELQEPDAVAVTAVVRESGAAVILLTVSEDDERIFPALRAGAGGVLTKSAAPHDLVLAVKTLAQGESFLSPGLARRLITEFAARPEPSVPSSDLVDELTAREREVVALVALGLSNDQIAERLVVSPATAKTHVRRAMVKLHAHDRAKLVVFAYEAGLAVPRANPSARAQLLLAS